MVGTAFDDCDLLVATISSITHLGPKVSPVVIPFNRCTEVALNHLFPTHNENVDLCQIFL